MTEYPFPMQRPAEGAGERTHLRHIALTVIEADPGCFSWILMESTGEVVVFDEEVAGSAGPYPSYAQALKDGYEALLAMAADQKAGPRASGEDESEDPVEESGEIGAKTCN